MAQATVPEGEVAPQQAASESPAESLQFGGEAGLAVGLISLFLFTRLFAVSHWNWSAAAALVDSFSFDDAISIAFGTLFERPLITGLLVALILPLGIFRDYWLATKNAVQTRAKNWFFILAMVATVYVLIRTFQMWWALATVLILTAILIGLSMIWKKGRGHKALSRLGKHVGLLLLAGLIILSVTVDTPWMSKERIVVNEGTIYGYVLQADPGFLKILTEDREVLILPDEDVVSRTLID